MCCLHEKEKNHLFQKGHTVALLLLNQCLHPLHFISFTYAESPQASLPEAAHILPAKQAERYLNLDKSHWFVICTMIYTSKSVCKPRALAHPAFQSTHPRAQGVEGLFQPLLLRLPSCPSLGLFILAT